MDTIERREFQHLSRERILDLLIAEIQVTKSLEDQLSDLAIFATMAHVVTHEFPTGRILVAVVPMSKDHIVHAYALDTYDTRGREQQWYAPIKADAAEAAKRLAYGKGETIGGKPKTALQVWNEMLPYLEPIPKLRDE